MAFAGKIAHTHNNKTKSVTFTENKTQHNNDLNPKL